MEFLTEEEQNKYAAFVWSKMNELSTSSTPEKEVIWHYTTGGSLLKILEAGKLWTTHVSCLNDSSEVRYGTELLIKAYLALNISSSAHSLVRNTFAQLAEFVGRGSSRVSHEASTWFVACFSGKEDDLSQWRAYASGENGYAIGFERARVTFPLDQQSALYKVNYDRSTHERIAREIAEQTVLFLECALKAKPVQQCKPWINEFLLYWDALMDYLSPLVKDPAFEVEDEYRIILRRQACHGPLIFSPKTSLIARHLPIRIGALSSKDKPRLPIGRIMIGPGRHKEINKATLEAVLQQLKYENVEVSVSKIPFQTT